MLNGKNNRTNSSNDQNWFFSMYFSTHAIYVFLIMGLIGWNAYNTYQYQILAERQSQLENLVTELLPSSSSVPSFIYQPPSVKQWLSEFLSVFRPFKSKDITKIDNSNSITKSPTVRIRSSERQ